MRDNVGIAELTSPMLRDLLRDACAGIGRVAVYPTLEDARTALTRNPPKVMVVGGAPLDPGLLELLKRATNSLGVLGLAVADAHDLQLARNAGALEGFARTPEGLRQLAMRVRPLLAPSLRPGPAAPGSQRTAAGAAAPTSSGPTYPGSAPQSKAPPGAAGAQDCALILLGSFAARGDAVGYLLSRLPTTLPGIVLVHGHIQPTPELMRLLAEESSWRIHEAGEPGTIQPGSLWIANRSAGWQLRSTPSGFALTRTSAPANANSSAAVSVSRIAGIDTFFEAAASTLGGKTLGVLLGATGDEGSHGLWALRNAGAYTLAQQDPSHSPAEQRAHATPVAHEVLGLDRLPQAIAAYCQGHNSYRSLRPQSA
jgi:chemotaxis response regulator CheB